MYAHKCVVCVCGYAFVCVCYVCAFGCVYCVCVCLGVYAVCEGGSNKLKNLREVVQGTLALGEGIVQLTFLY